MIFVGVFSTFKHDEILDTRRDLFLSLAGQVTKWSWGIVEFSWIYRMDIGAWLDNNFCQTKEDDGYILSWLDNCN